MDPRSSPETRSDNFIHKVSKEHDCYSSLHILDVITLGTPSSNHQRFFLLERITIFPWRWEELIEVDAGPISPQNYLEKLISVGIILTRVKVTEAQFNCTTMTSNIVRIPKELKCSNKLITAAFILCMELLTWIQFILSATVLIWSCWWSPWMDSWRIIQAYWTACLLV